MEGEVLKVEIYPDEWKALSYRRVFVLKIQLKAGDVPMRGDGVAWRMVFTTGGSTKYVAWYNGVECHNCSIDSDGIVRVLFRNHKLEAGRMYCELTTDFVVDGEHNVDTYRFGTGLILVGGESGNANDFNIDVLLPYLNVGINKETLWDEIAPLVKQVTNVEDTVLNLATINGNSLLGGGDIVITGGGGTGDNISVGGIPLPSIDELFE